HMINLKLERVPMALPPFALQKAYDQSKNETFKTKLSLLLLVIICRINYFIGNLLNESNYNFEI
ncbi:MAG: hypothetical protein Q8859_07950, partial [Bacteroidota bacterium]|nr:hypothetical protein [Bacteroidota bacterium]